MNDSHPSGHRTVRDLGLDRPHSARMYDYYLGGKTHYAHDRQAAEDALRAWPAARHAARANRAFMHRATRMLAERGIEQFLDIGTGIPTSPNLHEVAQAVRPTARIVYADNDPIVLAHARALLDSAPQGRTAYVEGDITRPDTILQSPQLTETLDLTRPVALSINAVLHFVPDGEAPYDIVRRFLAALPAGSALCLSHVTADFDAHGVGRLVEVYTAKGVPTQARSRDEVTRFFAGLDVLDPGVALAHKWRPQITAPPLGDPGGHTEPPTDDQVSLWAAVATMSA